MSRIKIALPENFGFATIIPVRITDVNYGGHVGNDTVLSLLHEARVQFLQHYGFTELNCGGTGLIMSDVAIEFKAELFYGTSIKAEVQAAGFSATSFDVYYRLTNEQNQQLIARAKTGMVCFNYSSKKVVAVPAIVLKKLNT